MEQAFALSVVEMGNLVAWFLLPLFRISSFFLAAPIFGAQLVPPRIKLVLAITVTALVMPVIPEPPKVDALSVATILLVAEQIFIGLGMAFILQMLMQIFVIGGSIAAMQMGLGFASMMDPVNGVSVTVISQFYLMLITLLYVSMDGHLATLQIFIESFSAIPIGSTLGPDFFMQLVTMMSWCLAGALLIALPAVTALLIINGALGIVSRAAPQLNIFSIGFPLMIILGLIILWASMMGIVPQFERFSGEALLMMRQLK
jgi:flagellar biosynthetic protein FliR